MTKRGGHARELAAASAAANVDLVIVWGGDGRVRLSAHLYNDHEDASRCLAALKAVLMHHKRDEVEHAFMLIEWLRRRDTDFDVFARKFLFTDAPIDAIEETEETPADGFAADLGLGNLKG